MPSPISYCYTKRSTLGEPTGSRSNVKYQLRMRIDWRKLQLTFGDQHEDVVLHILAVHLALGSVRIRQSSC